MKKSIFVTVAFILMQVFLYSAFYLGNKGVHLRGWPDESAIGYGVGFFVLVLVWMVGLLFINDKS